MKSVLAASTGGSERKGFRYSEYANVVWKAGLRLSRSGVRVALPRRDDRAHAFQERWETDLAGVGDSCVFIGFVVTISPPNYCTFRARSVQFFRFLALVVPEAARGLMC